MEPTEAQLAAFAKLLTELCSLSIDSPRVVTIGQELWNLDGMRAMLQGHEVYKRKCGPINARLLERKWGGIGGEQGWLS